MSSASSGEIQVIPVVAPLIAGQQEILRTVVTEACVDMFTSCGFATRIVDLSGPVEKALQNLVGFIGFVGAVRGSLMISAPAGLFRLTHPELGSKIDLSKADLFDWTGEMTNQLLGRVKRRFCALGRDFQVSTPTAIEGRELVRRFPVRAGVLDLALLVGGHVLAVCFEVTPPVDGLVFPDPAQPMEVSSEGDVVLF